MLKIASFSPRGVAIDTDGKIYVADTARILKFGSDGKFIAKWGSRGANNGEFCGADGITVDEKGNVYIVESFNHRIQKFTANGVYVMQWGKEGKGKYDFYSPRGIASDLSGNIRRRLRKPTNRKIF